MVSREHISHRVGQVKAIARSKTAFNSSITFGGNFANTFLSLICTIFVSRALGPSDFGILATFNALMATLIGLTDFGLGTTAIKLISKYLEPERRKASVVMNVIVKLELGTGLIVALIGFLFAGPIAHVLGGPQYITPVKLAFVSGAFMTAAAYYGTFFAAYGQFVKNALVNFSGAVLRLGFVLLLFTTAKLNLDNALIAYTAVPVMFFFIGLSFIPRDFLFRPSRDEQKVALHEIFHFTKWIFLSFVANSISGRLDVFMLSHFKGSQAVGYYSAAQQLVTVLPMIIGAVSTVLLPQVSRLKTKDEFKGFIKKVAFGASILAFCLLPMVIFGEQIIHLIFGSRYAGSFGAFRILFFGYIIALFTNPMSLVVYALNKPKIFTVINYFQLALTIVLNYIFIQKYGMIGAAWTFLVVTAIGSTLSMVYTLKEIKKLSN